MGQRELLFVVIASLALGSCVADYESNGKNLSWIYDIKNSETTQNQTYRLDTDTGAFRYHFDISAVDSYKFETNSNDAVTMGCYGWKDLTNKWHGTNYVADSHGRRNVRDINKPVEVFPTENERATRLFLDHLPQCLAFALDTPPMMVYVFTNHAPTKPPPVVFEPHDHVPHSSEVVHKVHEGFVPPYTGGGSPTVPLAKKKTSVTGRSSAKVPVARTKVTGGGAVKVPVAVTGGGSVKVPVATTTVTGGGSVKVPLAATGGGLVKVPLAETSVTGGGSVKVPLAATGGGSVKVPLAETSVTGGGSVKVPLAATGGGLVKVPLAETSVTGGGSVKVPLAATGGGSVKVPLAETSVTEGGSVKVPLAATGGSSVEVPLAEIDVTGGGSPKLPLSEIDLAGKGSPKAGSDETGGDPLALTPVSRSSSTTAQPAVDLVAEVTSVVPTLSTYRTVKGRQDLHGLNTKLPRPVISSGSGEDLTGIDLSVVPTGFGTTLEPTSAPSGTPISILSFDQSTSRPSSTFAPSFAVTEGDLFKESSYGIRLVSSPTVADDLELLKGTRSGPENSGSGVEIGTPLVSLSTQGTPTGPSLLEKALGFEIGPPLVPVASFDLGLGSSTGATLLDKPSGSSIGIVGQGISTLDKSASVSTTAAAPSDSEDTMDFFNPSKWGKALKSMVSAVLNVGHKILGMPASKTPSSDPAVFTFSSPSPTPTQQVPITTLYKVDIPTLSKTGLTSIGSKLVDLPSIGPLATPSGRPTAEVPSGFKISVKETNPGPDSIINIDVSPPAQAFLANLASRKTTLGPTDSGTPSASSPEPTGRPFAGTTSRPVSDLHVDVSEFVPTSSRRPETDPAIRTIPSSGTPIEVTLFTPSQRIELAKLPSFPTTVSTGFTQGPTISTIGEFISSRPTALTGGGLQAPSTTPSTFVNSYDFSTKSDRPSEYGPSSLGPSTASGFGRTVTAAYLPPPTAEGPACSCVCPRG